MRRLNQNQFHSFTEQSIQPNPIANMKFVLAAVVVLAVAMGVQSSLIAGVPGLGLGLGLGVPGWGVPGLGLGLPNLGVPGIGLGVGLGLPKLGVPGIGLGVGLGLPGPLLTQGVGLVGVPSALKIITPQLPAAVNIASGPIGGIAVAKQASVLSPLVAPGATYVAKTRGAIHTAPLAGHIQSAASINVAPAPGTW